MKSHLVIRADASRAIGAGHVVRCLALAQAWQACGGTVTFLGSCEEEWLVNSIAAGGAQLVSIQEPHPCARDLEMTLDVLNKHPDGWLVLDGYHFDAGYQRAIREADHRVLLFDDTAEEDQYEADGIVNQNIGAEDLHYSCPPGTRLLLGTRYAMLRREFLPWRGWRRPVREAASRVLITLGAGDSRGQVHHVLEALAAIDRSDLEVTVVGDAGGLDTMGPGPGDKQGSPHIRALGNVENMADLMAWADVAVSAGGSTCWELAFMGLPNVILVMAENQRANAQGLAAAGVSVGLGWHQDVTVKEVAGAVTELLGDVDRRREMSQRGQALVDGRGPQRVIEEARLC